MKVCSFAYASEVFRDDREVVVEVMRQQGFVLRFASEDVRCDRDVVRLAMKQDGIASGHVGLELRSDQDVALQAIMVDKYVWRFGSISLQCERSHHLAAADSCEAVSSEKYPVLNVAEIHRTPSAENRCAHDGWEIVLHKAGKY